MLGLARRGPSGENAVGDWDRLPRGIRGRLLIRREASSFRPGKDKKASELNRVGLGRVEIPVCCKG